MENNEINGYSENQIIEGANAPKGAALAERRSSMRIKMLVAAAMFTALAYAVSFLSFKVVFLTLDIKDAVITIGSLIFGPVFAFGVSLATALLEFLTVSDTGVYGLIMNFASSFAFSASAGLVYRFMRNRAGAYLSFLAASTSMVSVMMLLNLFVTPYYMGVAQSQVVAMIPTLFLPFNAAKALLNSAIAMILYKPVTTALRQARFIRGEAKMKINRQSVLFLFVALFALFVAVAIFLALNK